MQNAYPTSCLAALCRPDEPYRIVHESYICDILSTASVTLHHMADKHAEERSAAYVLMSGGLQFDELCQQQKGYLGGGRVEWATH